MVVRESISQLCVRTKKASSSSFRIRWPFCILNAVSLAQPPPPVMQVCGGSQSFNVVTQLSVLGRWKRIFTIPNQSSVPKAYLEFDHAGRMKPSPYYARVVDVMAELVKLPCSCVTARNS